MRPPGIPEGKKAEGAPPLPSAEEMEIEHPGSVPINRMKGAFDGSSAAFGGVNSTPSVFERSAVFRREK